MMRVILDNKYLPTVIAVEQGDLFYAKKVILDEASEYLVSVQELLNGVVRLRAKRDVIAVVERVWDIPTGVNRIVAIRTGREKENVGKPRFEMQLTHNHQLAVALHFARIKPVPVRGGSINSLIYDDEIIVPYNSFEAYGWIIKKVDAENYIAAFDDGRPEILHVWRELRIDERGRESCEWLIEGWNEPPGRRDPSPCPCTEYTILYDRRSRIVRQILLTNGYFENVSVPQSPLKSIAIGRPLPANLAWR